MNKQEEKQYVVGVGESTRIYCNECQSEYEVLHEPMYRTEEQKKGFGGLPKSAKFCPFCGTEDASELEIRDSSVPEEVHVVCEQVLSEDRVHRIGEDGSSEQMKRWACQPVAATLRELRKIKAAGLTMPRLVNVPGDERLRLGARRDRYHRFNSSGRQTKVYAL